MNSRFAPLNLLILGFFLLHCGEPAPLITTKDGAEMILLPTGDFLMGGQEEDFADRPKSGYINYASERPRHRVSISSFYIDKFEVTNAQYAKFLEATDQGQRSRWDHRDQPQDTDHKQRYLKDELKGENQPALGLNWFDAFAYCNWAGKRLPTEAEWEYAGRGTEQEYRKYPWGNQDPSAEGLWRANYRPDGDWAKDGQRHSAPVGTYPDGVSPFGVMDMAGNAEEWVSDWLSFSYYKQSDNSVDPQGPAGGKQRVIKGGSYAANKYHIRLATRLYGNPKDKSEFLGFRCAKDL